MEQNELQHHGILGQRWGVRRYQNKDGSLTAAGKKKYGTLTNYRMVQAAKKRAQGPSKAEIKIAKARAKARATTQKEIAKYDRIAAKKGLVNKNITTSNKSESSNTAKESKPVHESPKITKKKNDIIKSNSPALLYKNADLFTTEELRSIKERFNLTSDIKSMDKSSINRGKNFVNTIKKTGETVDAVASAVSSGTKLYNNVAKVLNSVYDTDLKIIGEKQVEAATKITQEIKYKNGKLTYNKETKTDNKGNTKTVENSYDDNPSKEGKTYQTTEYVDGKLSKHTTTTEDAYGNKTTTTNIHRESNDDDISELKKKNK